MLLVLCRGSGGQMTGRQGHSALTRLLTHSVNIPLYVCVCVCVFERDESSSTLWGCSRWTAVVVRLAKRNAHCSSSTDWSSADEAKPLAGKLFDWWRRQSVVKFEVLEQQQMNEVFRRPTSISIQVLQQSMSLKPHCF